MSRLKNSRDVSPANLSDPDSAVDLQVPASVSAPVVYDHASIEGASKAFMTHYISLISGIASLRDVSSLKKVSLTKKVTCLLDLFNYTNRAASVNIASDSSGGLATNVDLASKLDRLTHVVDVIDQHYAYLMQEVNKTYSSVVSLGSVVSTSAPSVNTSSRSQSVATPLGARPGPSKSYSVLVYPISGYATIKC